MDKPVSRRRFLKSSALTLGTVAVCDLEGIGRAAQGSGVTTLVSVELKGSTKPHVIVKLYPGRSEEQKIQLAEAIVKVVVAIAQCDEQSVSVAIEEIAPADWAEKVYKPDILTPRGKLYKKPGYTM
jgi:4-oxalocrotonate tautomerase